MLHIEEKYYTLATKRKLRLDPDCRKIFCETGGQPLILNKITKHRKQTQQVRTPTKRKRAKTIHDIRQDVAGPAIEASDYQLALELKRKPLPRRESMSRKAGIKGKVRVKVSAAKTLEMKESLGLSWRQQRTQNRMLRKEGIQLGKDGLEW